MPWSWTIGRLAGIQIRVHATVLILFLWVGLVAGRSQLLQGLAIIVLVFGVIVLHELGHALMARRFGIATREIVLLPIGGLARLEKMPEQPRQELLVALAGPAVNLVLALVALAALQLPLPEGPMLLAGSAFTVNVMIGLFNLLPAFPMDGGRVLRALLSTRMSSARATRYAAEVGQLMALGFGATGVLAGNPMLVFVALFVFMGADAELTASRVHSVLAGQRVREAMAVEFAALSPEDPLSVAVERLLDGFQQHFPLVENDRVVGMLSPESLFRLLAEKGPDLPVREACDRQFAVAHPEDGLEETLRRFQQSGARTLPVVEKNRLVGLLTREHIVDLITVRDALTGNRAA
ncbi:MAG: site-2 protease family protein [Armatimonadetes bacterium]|nr:site-2 protease family protein [Armatimonadota bacterium]